VESLVVIGAGDCPFCGGDVVFDVHGGREQDEQPRPASRRSMLRETLRRLRGD
jgi:hypothetical protein